MKLFNSYKSFALSMFLLVVITGAMIFVCDDAAAEPARAGSVPIPAIASICPIGTNGVKVGPMEIKKTMARLDTEGCTAAKPIWLQDGTYFIYGVRVLIGESAHPQVSASAGNR